MASSYTLIDDRYVFSGGGSEAALVAAFFVCWPSGLYTITADGLEIWSGRQCLQAALRWAGITGEAIALADVAAANCGVSPGAERETA